MYTKMLRKALNIHWSSHTSNLELYGNLPSLSDKIASRRMQLAGHCHRHPELSAQQLVLWQQLTVKPTENVQERTILTH